MSEQTPRERWIVEDNRPYGTPSGIYVLNHDPGPQQKLVEVIHVIEKSAYDELLKRHLSIESIGPLALENQKLRADLAMCVEALKLFDKLIEQDKLFDPEVLSTEEIGAWNRAKETLAKLSGAKDENRL